MKDPGALLSICVPSNLPFEGARHTIDSCLHLSRLPSVEVVVSDNSKDSKKKYYYEALTGDRFRYIESGFSDAAGNWNEALSLAEGDYICFLSDDDQLVALPGFDATQCDVPAGYVGFRPTMAMYTEGEGLYRATSFEITDAKAVDRIKSYLGKNGGANTTLFSFFEKALLKRYSGEWRELHPYNGGYSDWAWVLGMVSTGPIASNHRLLYVYNNRNWSTNEDISRNVARTFSDAGLPGDSAFILPILLALDSFGAICRRSSPVSTEEKLEAGLFAVEVYFNSFVSRYKAAAQDEGLSKKRRRILVELINNSSTSVDKIAASLFIADEWIGGARDAYVSYYRQMLTPGIIGDI